MGIIGASNFLDVQIDHQNGHNIFQEWARAVISWDARVQRAHDNKAWPHALLNWRSYTWLFLQRLRFSAFGESTTRTRCHHGGVQQSWVAGVDLAHQVMAG